MQIAVQHDLLLHQMDAKTAYLNATIYWEIYIEQPQYFKKGENRVYYLNKSLYGLKKKGTYVEQLMSLVNFEKHTF